MLWRLSPDGVAEQCEAPVLDGCVYSNTADLWRLSRNTRQHRVGAARTLPFFGRSVEKMTPDSSAQIATWP